jgi:hypothetical protein
VGTQWMGKKTMLIFIKASEKTFTISDFVSFSGGGRNGGEQ